MGQDIVPAVITNNTPYIMVVKNGDLESGSKPGVENFASIGPGESSDRAFRSIDALAVYTEDGRPIIVEGTNGKSYWWKVPDANHGSIKINEKGTVSLDTSYGVLPLTYHFPDKKPEPSEQSKWGFKPEYLNTLLKEKSNQAPAQRTPEPRSELEKPAKPETLAAYLNRNHDPDTQARILQAIQERLAEQQITVAPERTV